MDERQSESFKITGKAVVALVALGVASCWAPTLCSLLVIVVMLNGAAHAWRTVAKLPPRQVAELVAVAGFALGIGFLAKLGVAPLILTGLALIIIVPLWRLAREDPRPDPE